MKERIKNELNAIIKFVKDIEYKSANTIQIMNKILETTEDGKTRMIEYYRNKNGDVFSIETVEEEKTFYKVQKDGDLRKFMHFPDVLPEKPEFSNKEDSQFKFWDDDVEHVIYYDHIETEMTVDGLVSKTRVDPDRVYMNSIFEKIKVYRELFK